jgi:hypothetical protein
LFHFHTSFTVAPIIMAGGGKRILMSEELVHPPEVLAMAAQIAKVAKMKPLIQKYRAVQSYQITDYQSQLLNGITPEKIAEAKLRDLIEGVKALKTVEHMIEGKPTEIRGLVAYLVQLEREDSEKKNEDAQDAEYEDLNGNP